jgi:hypothetical protein
MTINSEWVKILKQNSLTSFTSDLPHKTKVTTVFIDGQIKLMKSATHTDIKTQTQTQAQAQAQTETQTHRHKHTDTHTQTLTQTQTQTQT